MALEIPQTMLSMENVRWEKFGDRCKYGHVRQKIFGDGCVKPNCMATAVGRPIT